MITKDRKYATGQLDKRIKLQSLSGSDDGRGGTEDVSPTTETTLWADIKPLSGDEVFGQEALQGNISHRIVLRHNPDYTIDNEKQFDYNGRVFNIKYAINRGEQDRYLECMVEEEV